VLLIVNAVPRYSFLPRLSSQPCSLSMQQNRRAQLNGRDSWLIFSQDSVAPFSSVVGPPVRGPGVSINLTFGSWPSQGPVNGGGTGTRIKPDVLAPGVRPLLAKWLLAAL
jgi:hypothetical protein